MKSLTGVLCAGMLCLCASAAQAQNSVPHDRPPMLRCGKVKFVSEKGQPLARQEIGVMWLMVDWDHPPVPGSDALKIPIKARKQLKTDAKGEVSIPNVKDGLYGPYLLELLVLIGEKESYPEGHFQSSAKPEGCVQVLEIQGEHVVVKS